MALTRFATRSAPRTLRTGARGTALVLLLALVSGACASSGTGDVKQAVTVFADVKNDLVDSPLVEVFVLPVRGDWHDRIVVGVVEGASEARYDIRIPATGRYYLVARRVAPVDNAPRAFPFDRPQVRNSWISRRFNVEGTTRRIEWRLRPNAVAVHEEEGGLP